MFLFFRSCRQGCGLQNKSLAKINFAIITKGITKIMVTPHYFVIFLAGMVELQIQNHDATVGKIPALIKIKLALPPPPTKTPMTPPQNKEFYVHGGFSSGKNQKMSGAHKIGAAISGPRIAGVDMRIFLIERESLRGNLCRESLITDTCSSQDSKQLLLFGFDRRLSRR